MHVTIRRSISLLAVALGVATGCGAEEDRSEPSPNDPGPIHVHGLGINPADRALFIATHTGLFRAPEGEEKAERVAGRYQDTMGFTVVGPDRFLGSGHPDGREDLPPFLGLIESRDAGKTWKPLSLQGQRDFHVLEAAGARVYGFGADFETREQALFASSDGGERWSERKTPEPLRDLAIEPGAPDRVVASGEHRLYSSADRGSRWRPLGDEPGLLAWAAPDKLYLVGLDGRTRVSSNGGEGWETVGLIDGEPAAFAHHGPELYVALHDGTVKRSTDGGKRWTVRSRP
jgi:hypothetical protein